MVEGVYRAGERGLLIELASLAEAVSLHRHLSTHPLPGQDEAVAAARTVLLRFTARGRAAEAVERLAAMRPEPRIPEDARQIEIPVCYDGEDLDGLAELLGMSREALIEWHTSTEWVGAFGGFAPGFTYCAPRAAMAAGEYVEGIPEAGEAPGGGSAVRLEEIPRRRTPRTSVPAGAVAVAGEFSAVYPRSSPGGWQLIGRTDVPMWDLERAGQGGSPALLRPGDIVRYRAVHDSSMLSPRAEVRGRPENQDPATEVPAAQDHATEVPAAQDQPDHRPRDADHRKTTRGNRGSGASGEERSCEVRRPVLSVLNPGMQTLIQDQGRPGVSDLGVPQSGAADRPSLEQANRLVGNGSDAAALEVLNGGARLRAEQTTVVAVTGAESQLTVTSPDGLIRAVPLCSPVLLAAGETLSLAPPRRGLRNMVAVRGGIAARRVLGSAATDTLSGLGPDPLQAGDMLRAGTSIRHAVGEPELSTLRADGDVVSLRFTYGPRDAWFSPEEQHRLAGQFWVVTAQSDRIGLRLAPDSHDEGARPLKRQHQGELPSEGIVAGALQMPPDGNPVLFLADHPVTGGYPVIGVVIEEDLPAASQLAPGSRIRFIPAEFIPGRSIPAGPNQPSAPSLPSQPRPLISLPRTCSTSVTETQYEEDPGGQSRRDRRPGDSCRP